MASSLAGPVKTQVRSDPEAAYRPGAARIGALSYHPASRVFVVDVEGGEPVTNHPRILEQEEAREHGRGRG